MSRDLRTALVGAWLCVSLVTALAAAAPFILPAQTIAELSPVCESRRRDGRECWMCGSTTAFIAIGRGDWPGAVAANRTAVPLFLMFAVNAALAAAFLLRRNVRSHQNDIMEPET